MTYDGPEHIPGYRDLVRIGQGGFSVVYQAHQEAFDRPVAVKVLMVGSDEQLQRRFVREARLTGRLSGHPHVITVLDAGMTWSGRPYLATEFYGNGSLQDRINKTGPLPALEVVQIGAKIADALAAAHESGTLHRDVKPSNILVSRFGEPVLADFGVSCLLDRVAEFTLLDVFSPLHAAPELVDKTGPEQATPTIAADLYALGTTLHQLLHGKPPYSGDVASVIWQTVHAPVPRDACPDLPDLVEVLARAMAKSPGDRYPDAPAFASALRALLPDPAPEAAALVPPLLDAPSLDVTPVRPVTAPPPPPDTAEVLAAALPAPAPELTVLRPDRQLDAPPAPARKGRSRLLVPLLLLAAAALATTVMLLRGNGTPATANSPAPSLPAPAASTLDRYRPGGLAVQDDGASITARWTPPAASDYLFLALQSQPVGGKTELVQLANGTREFQLSGLDPVKGYCFTVGAVVRLGNPSVVAWSAPTCIRNASPAPAASEGTRTP